MIGLAGGYTEVTDCLFEDNVSAESGLITSGGGRGFGFVRNSTFVRNLCGSGVIGLSDYATIENTLITLTEIGPAIIEDCCSEMSCCDYYANGGGDWSPWIEQQLGVRGNIRDNPLLCGGENPELPYALHANSPCAAANSGGCGTIGLYDVGCVATATEATSWGGIKALYRN
jgi:hypothetical protein